MTVFVELTTDAFEDRLNDQRDKRTRGSRSRRAGRRIARRPTRGLEVKDDTAAAIKVIQADGTELPIVDSSSPDGSTTSGYANFILQNVSEQRMEKHQIVETFGESYIFFFGENPRFLNVTSVLVNSHDFNWEAEWWENYDKFFRGTRLVELGARLYMFYDDNIVEGYMLNAQATKVAEEPFLIQMSFVLYITNYRNVSFIGNPQFPIRASVALPPGVQLTGNRAGEDIVTKYQAAALDKINNDSVGVTGQLISDIVSEEGFGQKSRLSSFLREVPPTLAIAPDVQAAINQIADTTEGINLQAMAHHSGKPLRGLIASNIDEYVGRDAGNTYYSFEPGTNLPTSLAPTIRSQMEVDNLFRAAIDLLSCYGADVDDPGAMTEMGLFPHMDPAQGATFTPSAEAGFGFGIGGEVFASSSASIGSASPDPLGAVYGRSEVEERRKDNRFVQGAGDSSYGFTSYAASGPGFAKAGFGLSGGTGYGSGQGAGGDPGFQDIRNFTFAGVSDNRSAFQRFLTPQQDASRFGNGTGLGSSTAGVTGSASFAVGGSVSAFGMVALEGDLDLTGGARGEAGVAVTSPFGGSCIQGSAGRVTTTGTVGLSAGFVASASLSGGVSVGGSAGFSFP